MSNTAIDQLGHLTTPHLADGCLKTNVSVRCAPPALRPLAAQPDMTHRLPCYVEFAESPDIGHHELIARELRAYNAASLGPPNINPLVVLLRSQGAKEMVGGLWGRTSFEWFFIELLFVPEKLRGAHLGTELLNLAEAKAKRRGCLGAWLDTFSASALKFYEKNGYKIFGELNDYPPGNTRYFLQKRFV